MRVLLGRTPLTGKDPRAAAHPAQPEIDRLHALLALPAYRADRPAPVRKDRR